jgi:hypothetical protein
LKKRWEKPELIALVRSRPEENVLGHCKTQSSGAYPGTWAQHCGHTVKGTCAACQDRGGGAS